MTSQYENDCEQFKSFVKMYRENGMSENEAREAAHARLREWDRDMGALTTRRACIEQARAAAKALDEKGEAHAALTMLADEYEKAINPRDTHIDAVYGAYLEGYRTALTGAHFMPALGVFARTAAVLGAIDGTTEPPTALRSRSGLFEAVVALLQRRE